MMTQFNSQVCRTAKPDRGISLEDMNDLLVTVNISGVSTTCSASSCLYTFWDNHTPVIHSMLPNETMPPPGEGGGGTVATARASIVALVVVAAVMFGLCWCWCWS
jgi:hypothetical protein